MDIRLKRKYLKKARDLLRKKERENAFERSITTVTPNETLQSEDNISIHIETNKELKRLLLASVGYDLQQELETLINEKTRLHDALNQSVTQLDSLSEEADHLSIECDIWRSKFLASRVMIDELMRFKLTSSTANTEFVRSINTLLDERQMLGRHVAVCNAMLQQCLMHLNKSDGLFVKGHMGNIVEVAAVNTRATKQLLSTFTINEETTRPPDTDTFNLSYGEQLAQQVLYSSNSEPKQTVVSSLPHLSVSERHLLQRTNVDHRLNHYHHQPELLWTQESYSIHYCKNCRGKLLFV